MNGNKTDIPAGHDEAAALWASWRQGQTDDLRQAIAGMHFGVVLTEAEMVAGDPRAMGLHPDDLVEPFTRALYRAIDKFDSTRPEPFSVYVRAFIRGEMSNVRRNRRAAMSKCRSLSTPVSPDGDAELGDLVADGRATAPWADALFNEALDLISEPLPRWQRMLVRMHFVEGWSHREIAAAFGMARERITDDLATALDAIASAFTVDELESLLGTDSRAGGGG